MLFPKKHKNWTASRSQLHPLYMSKWKQANVSFISLEELGTLMVSRVHSGYQLQCSTLKLLPLGLSSSAPRGKLFIPPKLSRSKEGQK